jgi:hypothetical protein
LTSFLLFCKGILTGKKPEKFRNSLIFSLLAWMPFLNIAGGKK